MFKVVIDKDKCIGCGSCSALCPEVFKMKEDKAFVIKSPVDNPAVKEAKDLCPTQAIILSEAPAKKGKK